MYVDGEYGDEQIVCSGNYSALELDDNSILSPKMAGKLYVYLHANVCVVKC